ncbi:hypothetical protein PNOK_0575900 [Pyrrhoderma noxium]|uniref:DUF6534 domain-containing protein n=1 Tax=Pyrrhoderma noxium TaxID=2282107 RepID=A0A286UH15_9AGAM|nr:hypothetical protein PNOK_0575900 [Pyrrhoderma noxium]
MDHLPSPLPPPPQPIVITLGNKVGALLFGLCASAVLFGVNSIQVFYYFRKFKRDKRALKSITTIILSAVNYMLVTFVYSLRIYIISDRAWYIAIVPLILGTVGPVLGIAIASKGFENTSFVHLKEYSWMLYGSFSFAVACDLSIVSALCYYLHRGRSGLKESTTLVNTLILYCITTGAVSSLAHLANLILYVTMPTAFVYIGVFAFTPELYSNALLATLNARDHLRNRSSFVNHTSQIRFGTDTRPRLSQTDSAQTMSVARSQSQSSAPSVAFSTLEQCYWTIEEENIKDECSIRQSSRLHYV